MIRSVLGALPAIAAAILVAAAACPVTGTMSDCIDATCRITAPDGGRGTGCVFERSQGAVYVLTAAHVVGNARRVECEFWRQGHQSAPLPGVVVLRVANDQTDAAVIAVDQSHFGGALPPAIPLAPRDFVVGAGQTLTSVGCAGGAWSTGWKGHALGYDGGDLCFVPAPAMGRSGSALFDAEGERIVGVVRARTLNSRQGIASSVQSLYGQLCRAAAERQVQCGPNGCGPNGCPAPQYRLLPYRQEQDDRWRQHLEGARPGQQAPGTNPWPTLPVQPIPTPLPQAQGQTPAPPQPSPTQPDKPDPIPGLSARIDGLEAAFHVIETKLHETAGATQAAGLRSGAAHETVGNVDPKNVADPGTASAAKVDAGSWLTAGLVALGVSSPAAGIGVWLAGRLARRVVGRFGGQAPAAPLPGVVKMVDRPVVTPGQSRTENVYIRVPEADPVEEAKRAAERVIAMSDPKAAAFFMYRDDLAKSQTNPG
ncbi:MAG: trypsin-like peptidase domain-containing protein [Phycisphaerae bacterium]|nr:trypsin-like peptidase domain-containing protein [Phycisphaerae bacterium]